MTQKRKKIFLVILLFIIAWCSGLVGAAMVKVADLITPCTAGKHFKLNGVSYSGISEMPRVYAVFRISSERMMAIAAGASGVLRFAIPPRIIRNGLHLDGTYFYLRPDGSAEPLPVHFVIDDAVRQPFLSARFPRELINEILRESDLLGRRSREKEWALGHYDLFNYKTFDTLEIYTLPVGERTSVRERHLVAEATGWVRYKLEENIIDIRTTARVNELAIEADLLFDEISGSYKVSHKAQVTKLKGNFNNMAGAIDKQLCDMLQDSIEKSLNKDRNRVKLARLNIPLWVPTDLNIDVKIVP